jgi:hypothetical protein
VATRGAGPRIGRGFGSTHGTFAPFSTSSAVHPVTHVLVGAACGALAVCGLQFLMVVLSEIELNRSVDAISE